MGVGIMASSFLADTTPPVSEAFLDDFNRANGALGADYSTITGAAPPTILSTAVRSTGGSDSGAKRSSGSPISPDMWARLNYDVLDATDSNVGVSLYLRMPDTGVADQGIYMEADATFYTIAVMGPSGVITSITSATGDSAGAHVLDCYVRGPLIELWLDGIRRLTHRETGVLTGGRAGFWIVGNDANNESEVEQFEYGPLSELDALLDANYRGVAGSVANGVSETATPIDMPNAGSIAVGETLIIGIGADNAATVSAGASSLISVSDPRGNTWTLTQQTQDPGAAAAGITVGLAYCVVANAYTDGDDITLNFNPTTTAKAAVIHRWAGLGSVAVAATSAVGASTTPSVSITPTGAGQLVVGVLALEAPSAEDVSMDADTTNGTWKYLMGAASNNNLGTVASNAQVVLAVKRVTASGAQTWNPTVPTFARLGSDDDRVLMRDWAAREAM